MWWNEWEIQFSCEQLPSGLEVCPCCFENVISVSRNEPNQWRKTVITLYTSKANEKGKQGLRFLRRPGAISGPSSGQHPVPWTGENIAGRILLDISKHHIRRSIKAQTCHAQCGSIVANHYHTFWDCPKLNAFWKGIQASLGRSLTLKYLWVLTSCT